MIAKIKKLLASFIEAKTQLSLPIKIFHSQNYLRINARRLEHLASLRIDVRGKSVLEVGAGIGDHSHYYIDRACKLTITEVRNENLAILRRWFPSERIEHLDIEKPRELSGGPYDIVHCYGLLYHLNDPKQALEFMRKQTGEMLFLETCVTLESEDEINVVPEKQGDPSQSYSGKGCRPTRKWIFSELKKLFPYVYMPHTQPNHIEFPTKWSPEQMPKGRTVRSVFIASLQPIENDLLSEELLMVQRYAQ